MRGGSGYGRPLAVAGLLLLAALGARARATAHYGAPPQVTFGGGVADLVFSIVLGIAVLLGLGLLVALLLAFRRNREPEDEQVAEAPPTSRVTRLLVGLMVLAVLAAPIAVLLLAHRSAYGPAAAPPSGVSPPVRPPLSLVPGALPGGTGLSGRMLLGVSVLGVAALIIAAVALTRPRRRPPRDSATRPDGTPAGRGDPTLLAAIEAGADALSAGAPPRAAVIGCYVEMERVFADAGTARGVSDTPTEFLRRVTGAGLVRSEAARALTELFRVARFSRHPIEERHREAALTALTAIREEVER